MRELKQIAIAIKGQKQPAIKGRRTGLVVHSSVERLCFEVSQRRTWWDCRLWINRWRSVWESAQD